MADDLTPAEVTSATGCPAQNVVAHWGLILDAMRALGIASRASQIGMAATVAIETGDFTPKIENLNYGTEGLVKTWPSRFPTEEQATEYARHPEKIANYVYANRNGNGDVASGDGWRYRGRGFIQITGRSNYDAFSEAAAMDVEGYPDDALKPLVAAQIAAWFWKSRNIAPLCDQGDWKSVRRKVNGGTIHLAKLQLYVSRFAP